MIFYVCMNGTQIAGNDILNLAKRKAKDLKLKYPKERITVEWSSWYEGKKGKDNYHILDIDQYYTQRYCIVRFNALIQIVIKRLLWKKTKIK